MVTTCGICLDIITVNGTTVRRWCELCCYNKKSAVRENETHNAGHCRDRQFPALDLLDGDLSLIMIIAFLSPQPSTTMTRRSTKETGCTLHATPALELTVDEEVFEAAGQLFRLRRSFR
jgi:hypothetical protein